MRGKDDSRAMGQGADGLIIQGSANHRVHE